MRREVPNPQLPGMGAQLAVLPPAAKVVVAPLMLVLGVVAIVLDPGSVFAWVLLVAAVALGGPLLLQGLGELRARQVFERERARARAELVVLQADLREVIAEKRGVERFLLERGYTSEKARRWIALECGVVLPRAPR